MLRLASPAPGVNAIGGGEALRIVLAAVASFVVVVWTIPFVRRIALANGITDQPCDDRWYKGPRPYLGGVALVAGALSAAAVLPGWEAGTATLLLGAVVLSVVGLVDDVRTVSPLGRVLFEAGVAAAVFFAGTRVEIFNDPIDFVLTVGWFVVVTNAFNLLDNVDGGMAPIAAVVAAAIATVALAEGQVLVGGLAVVTCAACVGFLLYNWPPAQILMGDAGSLFLGFMLAALALELRPPLPHPASVVGLILLLSPALFDTSLVVVSRLRAGRSIFVGGTDHTSHRLMRLGLGQRATAAVLTLAASALAGSGVLVCVRLLNPVVGAMAASIPCAVFAIVLLCVPVYDRPGQNLVSRPQMVPPRDERPRGERRPAPSPSERVAVGAIGAVTGVGVFFAGAHPTANRWSDAVLVVALAVSVVAAGSIARSTAWVFASGVAAVLAPGVWALVAVIALSLAMAGAVKGDLPHRRIVGALIGALTVQSLLRLDGTRFGLSALAAAAAIAVLDVSAWSLARRSTRARLRTGAAVVAGAALLVGAAFGLKVVQSRATLELAVQRSQEGLAAAREGHDELAAQLLGQAGRAFDDARAELRPWYARLASALPVVGQHQRALEVLTAVGADVSGAGADAASSADVQGLVLRGGQLDLERVAGMATPLASLVAALDRAGAAAIQADSPWLLPPFSQRIDVFARSVRVATRDAETASEGVAVLPALLGGQSERRYFVAFATPAESRELGGFTGAYGLLTAEAGRLTLSRTGRIQELNDAGRGRRLTDPTRLPARYRALRPEDFWQNITGTPDFPTVAETVRQMWPQSGGGELDGVIYLDPYSLASLLQLTGPVTVEGRAEPLTADNAADFLLRGQYEAFDQIDERSDFLLTIVRTVFDRLTSGDLPGVGTIADALAPDAHQRRLLAHSFHPDEQRLFERLGIDGRLPPVRGDFLSVGSSNLGQNKIDALLRRTIDYEVMLDPDRGTASATVTVTLHNTAPPSGLADYVIGNPGGVPKGTNLSAVAVYTPLQLVEATTTGGQAINVGASEEYGRRVYTALLSVPPNSELSVTFALQGPIDLRSGYRLDVVPQATANPDRLTVHVRAKDPWQVRGAGQLTTNLDVDASLVAGLRSD